MPSQFGKTSVLRAFSGPVKVHCHMHCQELTELDWLIRPPFWWGEEDEGNRTALPCFPPGEGGGIKHSCAACTSHAPIWTWGLLSAIPALAADRQPAAQPRCCVPFLALSG